MAKEPRRPSPSEKNTAKKTGCINCNSVKWKEMDMETGKTSRVDCYIFNSVLMIKGLKRACYSKSNTT